jgi:hypothetical protein
MPVKCNLALKKAALPYANRHSLFHLYHCTNLVLLVTVQISVGACFGREKGACDLAPEASADLSDFQTSPLALSWKERKSP